MAKVGYARVSSYGQSLDVQLEKLADCERIFQEKQSARTDEREQLQLCLDECHRAMVLGYIKLKCAHMNSV